MRGGFAGSPPPDPVREYVTLMVAACMVGVAQKFRAKRLAAADRKILDFTFYFLSVFRFPRIRTQVAFKVKETGCKAFVNS